MLICVRSILTWKNSTEICSILMNPLWLNWSRNLPLYLAKHVSQSSFVSHWMTAIIKTKYDNLMPDQQLRSEQDCILNRHTLVYGAQCINSYVKPSGGSDVWEGWLKMVHSSKSPKATMHLDDGGKTSGNWMQKLDPQPGSSFTRIYEEHLYNLL